VRDVPDELHAVFKMICIQKHQTMKDRINTLIAEDVMKYKYRGEVTGTFNKR
jgi:hypothetical protein